MLKIVKKPEAAKEVDPKAAAAAAKAAKAAEAAKGAEDNGASTTAGVSTLQSFEPMFGVRIAMKYSHKLPNDDWVACEVELTIPCKGEDVEEAHTYAKDFCDGKINERVDEFAKAEAEAAA